MEPYFNPKEKVVLEIGKINTGIKFVLFETNYGPIIRGTYRKMSHMAIADEVRFRLRPVFPGTLGGGSIAVDDERRIVRASGFSFELGEPNWELVEKLLKEYFTDYTIKVFP